LCQVTLKAIAQFLVTAHIHVQLEDSSANLSVGVNPPVVNSGAFEACDVCYEGVQLLLRRVSCHAVADRHATCNTTAEKTPRFDKK
jgi:hypothetical protein